MLWRQVAKQPADVPKVSGEFGHAASTGATDGKLFFAIFSTGDLVAVDRKGAIAWTRAFGTPKSSYGYASSLIAYKYLFVQIDDSNNANLFALDPATGKTVWQKRRTVRESWASPVIAISGDREMVVLAENPTVERLRREHWRGGSFHEMPRRRSGAVASLREGDRDRRQ